RAGLAAVDRGRAAAGRGADGRAVLCRVDARGDEREGPVGAVAHAVLDEVEAALGLRARDAEAVGQQPAKVRGTVGAEGEQQEPGRDDTPAVRDDEAGPADHSRVRPWRW